MPKLWLVRHAQPLIDPGICYGRHDVPADAAATRQAATRLHAALPAQLAGCWHSPLQRCEQLALDTQALRPDLTLNSDDALAELDFGRWEARAWADIARADIDAWTATFAHHPPGGGESLSAMLLRVADALAQARRAAQLNNADVLWITHAGVVRCVLWLQQHGARLPLADEWTAPAPAYGEWMTVPLACTDTEVTG
ncbi:MULTISPECIES: histidine phosphatase family protein [unclassified Acidovorax]|uniref:histidine phosphatase family protein n=1 Tax=unclassified Acidovorax TaxID=2684926 RepID=UPI0028831545|nr:MULTISPECIES: histidine phosphatase family protein [unclassified Acidovorax]